MDDLKLKTHLAAYVGAIRIKDPQALCEYLKRNEKYFPWVTKENLTQLEIDAKTWKNTNDYSCKSCK